MAKELSLLVKPVSADCNMRCHYCFYLRPHDPYRSEEHRRMDDLTLRSMISGYMKSAGRTASFGWQGGEPLLAGLDFFKRVVAYQQRYGGSGQLVSNNLQTNGLLLNEAWAKFFKAYNFFIGISLDGPEAYHNAYRHTLDNTNGFDETMRGIETLRKHQVEFSLLTVINDITAKRPAELYQFFLKNGFHFLQFIPCVEFDREDQKVKGYSVKVEDYRDFLCQLFDLWFNRGKPVVSIRLFENILAIYMGLEAEICAFRDRCGTYVVVEYNGDVYPCDFFVEEEWKAGNLCKTPIERIVDGERIKEFNRRKSVQSSGCDRCHWNFICHSGCQHYRMPDGKNYLCGAYKDFFSYTEGRFQLLKREFLKERVGF